ncbi:hypothetical protein [Pontibacter oryzae]|uniref:Uncharacterized protein n=1 Tax=Pontibacter oryzae TaxID=2304593 RepID=A0A399S3D9_9BACT|nr:hypothetical protein [Pontibacter oryzae]RIJ36969.1 hypothetical protein D1627_14205 [Pontibacter oryzae]
MELLQALFSIRIKQMVRALQGLSWYHIPVLFTIAIFLYWWLFQRLQEDPFAIVLVAGAVVIMLLLHASRSDIRFMQHLAARHQLIFWVEYSLLLLPLHLLLLFAGQGLLILPLEMLLLIISHLQISSLQKSKARPYPFIHHQNFEWKAGMRKNFLPFLLIYTLGVALAPMPYATLFMLWLLLLVVCTFLQECEPYNLLLILEKKPSQFLVYKIKLHLFQYIIFTVPILLLHLALQPTHFIIILIAYSMFLLVLMSSVLLKYAHYEPNEKVSSASSILNALNLASPLLPFLIFFPLISSIRSYKQAIYRLNPFLHDFNS